MIKAVTAVTFALLISSISGMSMYAEAITMGFQDEYDPSNWTLFQNGGDGSVDIWIEVEQGAAAWLN